MGLIAYRKDMAYGPAAIRAEGLSLVDTPRLALVQDGSEVTIDGESLPGESADLDQILQAAGLSD